MTSVVAFSKQEYEEDAVAAGSKVRKGLWSPEEDERLRNHILQYGYQVWSSVPKIAGLRRTGKSCRLRWMNYLRPELKHGKFSEQEEEILLRLHKLVGNRWAYIATQLPGRTDNDVKNHWNSRIRFKAASRSSSGSSSITSERAAAASSASVPAAELSGWLASDQALEASDKVLEASDKDLEACDKVLEATDKFLEDEISLQQSTMDGDLGCVVWHRCRRSSSSSSNSIANETSMTSIDSNAFEFGSSRSSRSSSRSSSSSDSTSLDDHPSGSNCLVCRNEACLVRELYELQLRGDMNFCHNICDGSSGGGGGGGRASFGSF